MLLVYTNRFDNGNTEPSLPTFGSNIKFTIHITMLLYWIWLTASLGYFYLTALSVISLLATLSYKVIEKDFITKMLKLKLAYEPKK